MTRIILFLTVFLCFLSVNFSYSYNINHNHEEIIKSKAIILSTELDFKMNLQIVEVMLIDGPFENKKIVFFHPLTNDNIQLKENMRIFLQLTTVGNSIKKVEFMDVARDFHLFILFLLFFLFLILFGGSIGFRSFIALIITALCIIYLFMPMIINGHGFIFTTIIVCLIIVISSFVLICGFTKKSLTAIMGTIGGTVASGILAVFFGNLTFLTGGYDTAIDILIDYSLLNIDFKGLLYSGITIGVLGAAMDVSMTITSVIHELKKSNPKVSISSLFFSGLTVGRDIMATMTNTLILAYAGTSLPLLFVLALSNMTAIDIINTQFIAAEIVRSLCGSIGLLLTIPITSFIAAVNR